MIEDFSDINRIAAFTLDFGILLLLITFVPAALLQMFMKRCSKKMPSHTRVFVKRILLSVSIVMSISLVFTIFFMVIFNHPNDAVLGKGITGNVNFLSKISPYEIIVLFFVGFISNLLVFYFHLKQQAEWDKDKDKGISRKNLRKFKVLNLLDQKAHSEELDLDFRSEYMRLKKLCEHEVDKMK